MWYRLSCIAVKCAEEYYLRDINQLPIAIAEVIFKLAGKKLNCQLQDSLTENELSNEVDLVVTTPPFGERINQMQ